MRRSFARTEAIRLVASGNNALPCPKCGEEFLHHGRVSIYQRNEGGPLTRRTIVDEAVNSNFVIGDMDNPSARRHGLTIAFSCEYCGDVGELTIAQCEGQTLINWR